MLSQPMAITGPNVLDTCLIVEIMPLRNKTAFLQLIGIYLMDVHSVHDMFSQLKIKVNAETGVIRVAEYKYPGGKRLTPLPQHPIELTAIAPILYYEQTPPFSIVGMILGNPMMLMVVFSVAVVFGFPMLLSNLSEEELKEMQSSQVDPMQGFKSMLGVKEKEEEE